MKPYGATRAATSITPHTSRKSMVLCAVFLRFAWHTRKLGQRTTAFCAEICATHLHRLAARAHEFGWKSPAFIAMRAGIAHISSLTLAAKPANQETAGARVTHIAGIVLSRCC